MPTFVIRFDDGSTVTKSADTADLAKAAAKLERAKELGNPPRTDPRFKVAAVLRQDENADADKPAPKQEHY